jgi:ComF family protein
VSIRELVALIAPPVCAACGALAGPSEPLCGRCRRALPWLDASPVRVHGIACWAPVAYEGPARALAGALKFRGVARAAGAMASQMAANAPPGWLDGRVLVPVPLHPARRRRRGFNQAERIAMALAARAGMRVADCLERRGPRATQIGRGREERLVGLAGAVAARRKAPEQALLVDDVVTTGATLAACAEALRAAGAAEVRAIAYARTPGR